MTLWTIVNRGVVDFDGRVIDAEADGTVVDVTAGTALDSLGSPIVVPARGIAGVLRVDGELPPYVTRPAGGGEQGHPRVRQHVPGPPPGPGRCAAIDVERTANRCDRRAGRAAHAHGALPPARDRDVRRRSVRRGVEAAPASAPRRRERAALRRDRTGGRGVRRDPRRRRRRARHGLTLDEARAHAVSLGARLPTEFEWQLAAADPRSDAPSRWCGTGPRASTATGSPASPSSRAAAPTAPRDRSGTSTADHNRPSSAPSCSSPGRRCSGHRRSASASHGISTRMGDDGGNVT